MQQHHQHRSQSVVLTTTAPITVLGLVTSLCILLFVCVCVCVVRCELCCAVIGRLFPTLELISPRAKKVPAVRKRYSNPNVANRRGGFGRRANPQTHAGVIALAECISELVGAIVAAQASQFLCLNRGTTGVVDTAQSTHHHINVANNPSRIAIHHCPSHCPCNIPDLTRADAGGRGHTSEGGVEDSVVGLSHLEGRTRKSGDQSRKDHCVQSCLLKRGASLCV